MHSASCGRYAGSETAQLLGPHFRWPDRLKHLALFLEHHLLLDPDAVS